MPKTVPDLPGLPPSQLPFSKVVEANGFVFLAGQIGWDAAGRMVSDRFIEQFRVGPDRFDHHLGRSRRGDDFINLFRHEKLDQARPGAERA